MPDTQDIKKIQKIGVTITTGNRIGAGTFGDVYIGIGGREFNLSTPRDDFTKGAVDTFYLGNGANINDKEHNDPSDPPLEHSDVEKFPMYIRFEPQMVLDLVGIDTEWNLEKLIVEVTIEGNNVPLKYEKNLGNNSNLWLGRKTGKFFYLK